MKAKYLALSLLCIMIAGCAGPGDPRQEIEAYLKQCTTTHGYNPEAAASLGPHELGKGEIPWRECIYQKVEADLIPNSSAKDQYRRLIASDREMTTRVAAGQLTRAERRAKNEAAIGEISRAEEAEYEKRSQVADSAMKDEMQRQRARDMQRATVTMGGLRR